MSGTGRQRGGMTSKSVASAGSDGDPLDQDPLGDVIIDVHAAAAMVTLNRPRALNALNARMLKAIAGALPGFARDADIYALVIRSAGGRAFCAGGDLRQITGLGRSDAGAALQNFRGEYALNWHLECFTKPTLSLIDAMVLGSGVGLTLYGTHRIAGEHYSFAMPETRIGIFPDVGVSWAFARMPHQIGMYLGLTGRTIARADAYSLGLVTHCINADQFDAITDEIADADPIDPLLDERHEDPGPGELAGLQRLIAQCFSAPSVEEIVANLEAVRGAERDWAGECAEDLMGCAPLSLKVTHRLIRAARAMDLRQTLQFDCRLVHRFLKDKDFYEGTRTALIDKGDEPRWSPASLADVSEAMVDRYFAPLGKDELKLPARAQMQAARI